MTYELYGLHIGDDVVRYIGQTTVGLKRRLTSHRCNSRTPKTPVQFWIQKHGEAQIRIMLLATADTQSELDQIEIAWIARHPWPLLNVQAGGRSGPGFTHTPETKAKISAAARGRKRTAAQKKNISEGIRAAGRSAKQHEHSVKVAATMRAARQTKDYL